jgi:glycosyltransferase involved in cell wall biosynthesis
VKNIPKVSIVMPVYNGEKHLREAVDSMLAQSFPDFELVIVNDGSTDRSVEIIEGYDDPRIRLIENSLGKGVVGARNTGIANANGKYVAMMDCDDIAYPTRLEEQVAFLDDHPDYGMVGAWSEMIDEESCVMGNFMSCPASPEAIPLLLLFNNCFTQSTVLIRKTALPEGGYLYPGAEDYDLWVRIAQKAKVWNLQKVLVKYRVHTSSISFENATNISTYVREIINSQLASINIRPTESELDTHRKIGNMSFVPSLSFLEEAGSWLKKLYEANEGVRYYDHILFRRILAEHWIYVCAGSSELGPAVWKIYWASPLSKMGVIDTAGKAYLFIATYLRLNRESRKVIKRCGERILRRCAISQRGQSQ